MRYRATPYHERLVNLELEQIQSDGTTRKVSESDRIDE